MRYVLGIAIAIAAAAGCGDGYCADLRAHATALTAAAQPCGEASDCTRVSGGCGLGCGGVVNAENAAKVEALYREYEAGGCHGECLPCPAPIADVVCTDGSCR
jgi:hypothetical protein